MNETKLLFQFRRTDVQLEQLRSQHKHLLERISKLEGQLESLKAKSGSVEAGNMSESKSVPVPEAVHE